MQLTYFPTSQCLHTCSCSCWKPVTHPGSLGWCLCGTACLVGWEQGITLWPKGTPEPKLCGSPGKQLCTHPCKGSIHRVLFLMLPFLKDCSVSLAAPGLEQHCCLHPKQLQAQAGTTFPSTSWGLGNTSSLEISPVAIFGGRIDLEVLPHVIG